jgi:hypothetical protein
MNPSDSKFIGFFVCILIPLVALACAVILALLR